MRRFLPALLLAALAAAGAKAPLLSIQAVKRAAPGRLCRVRGTVARVFVCPPCPEGANCEPCPPDHLTLSDGKGGELYVLTDDPGRFKVGRKVELTVRVRPKRPGVGGVAGEGVDLVEP